MQPAKLLTDSPRARCQPRWVSACRSRLPRWSKPGPSSSSGSESRSAFAGFSPWRREMIRSGGVRRTLQGNFPEREPARQLGLDRQLVADLGLELELALVVALLRAGRGHER